MEVFTFMVLIVLSYVNGADFRYKKERTRQYFEDETCTVDPICNIALPQNSYGHCRTQRRNDIAIARQWYKLTDEKKKQTNGFPFKNIPWLNQTMNAIAIKASMDPFESRYVSTFRLANLFIAKINRTVSARMTKNSFNTLQDYELLYKLFNEGVKALPPTPYIGNPFYKTEDAINIFDQGFWMSDAFFVQRRLAGPCPFLIRKVTVDEKVGMTLNSLKKFLNSNFDWDFQLSREYGENITLDQAAKNNRLFVIYHEDHNDVSSISDMLDENQHDSKTVMNITSPITLFIKDKTDNLKVVAIQWNYTPDSQVFTPANAENWAIAKAMVDITDTNTCQGTYHLAHIHVSSTVYCIVFRRHFSTLHPLYDVMKYHCEGTVPHITTSYHTLLTPFSAGHLVLGVGHTGFSKLVQKAYDKHYYGILDYDNMLKAHGLDDTTNEKLSYYPFRDDGMIIWNELGLFAKKFVSIYYNDNDGGVQDDFELQSFANEISSNGEKGKDGGAGKMKRFPSSFATIKQLSRFIQSFLWLNVFHAVTNYPVEPYNTFVPLGPSKLYKDSKRKLNFAESLPNAATSIGIASFATILGNIRINKLMEHYDKVQDPKLRKLTYTTYKRLHTCVQNMLEKRNARRKANKKLTFQYLEPKWLTNSNHV